MSSTWNHSICDECWKKLEGDREPHRLLNVEREKCCSCGQMHTSGIMQRRDPNTLACKGDHSQ